MTDPLCLRRDVRPSDEACVREITISTGVFRPEEIEIAVELVAERLSRGAACGYELIFAEQGGTNVGYACYGHIAGTIGSYDLYWIAVDKNRQRSGIGRLLLDAVEQELHDRSARRVYVETSGRSDYTATRGFYERMGYRQIACLHDFYAPGDDKVIYEKNLKPMASE
jgi:ribosomal protein S18 acetylase RimI-like enzyme